MSNNKITEFIDTHLHFGEREDDTLDPLDIFEQLRELGLKKVFLLCFNTYKLNFSDIIRVVPYHSKALFQPDFVDANPFLQKLRDKIKEEDFIIPFLDFRIIHGNIESWLDYYLDSLYKGLKSLFIPEGDDFLQIESPIKILNITKSHYLDNQQKVMDYAQKNNLPIIYHVNLQNYFEYAREFLTNFPHLRINFPHLGYSRKNISRLFDNFENCYSDISGLKEYIGKNPKDYCDYIEYYKNQIMFGTDLTWNEAENIKDHMKFVEGLPLQNEYKKNLAYNVALKFLGREGEE
jgi:hypothetical protein